MVDNLAGRSKEVSKPVQYTRGTQEWRTQILVKYGIDPKELQKLAHLDNDEIVRWAKENTKK